MVVAMSKDRLTRELLFGSSSLEGYKNVGVLVLAPSTSEEPLNSMLLEMIAMPSYAIPKDTKLSTIERSYAD
jgi:hypothetical protein